MLNIYKAILTGDRLEWTGDAPDVLVEGRSIPVYVTFPPETKDLDSSARGERMAAVLEQIAKLPTSVGIDDPVAWQRELREERALDGHST